MILKLPQRFLSDEGPMLETLDYTIRIGSTPTFLYFDLYLYSAYAAHFVYFKLPQYRWASPVPAWRIKAAWPCTRNISV